MFLNIFVNRFFSFCSLRLKASFASIFCPNWRTQMSEHSSDWFKISQLQFSLLFLNIFVKRIKTFQFLNQIWPRVLLISPKNEEQTCRRLPHHISLVNVKVLLWALIWKEKMNIWITAVRVTQFIPGLRSRFYRHRWRITQCSRGLLVSFTSNFTREKESL